MRATQNQEAAIHDHRAEQTRAGVLLQHQRPGLYDRRPGERQRLCAFERLAAGVMNEYFFRDANPKSRESGANAEIVVFEVSRTELFVESSDAFRRCADDLAHCGATWASGVEATSIAARTWRTPSPTGRRSAAKATASMICS